MALGFYRPWLIQRLSKPRKNGVIKPPSFGVGCSGLNPLAEEKIAELFSFEYMGRDEYQTGIVGLTLAHIGKNHKKFIPFSIRTPFGKHIYIFCNKNIRKHVTNFIDDLVRDRESVKDKTYLIESFSNDGIQTCAWLELVNGVFFTTDKEMYDRILQLFRTWKFENNGLDSELVLKD